MGARPWPIAPELDVSAWCNTATPRTLAGLRGKVVVLHAFQMLCPGCVLEGTPFAQKLYDRLPADDVAVLGLHTVFEHHDAMTPVSLRAYLHEFRITMPVGVDRHEEPGGLPVTMSAYRMQGTPTLVVIDRTGRIRHHWFGSVDEFQVGMAIAEVISESQAV
jgi:peroxiredoxin